MPVMSKCLRWLGCCLMLLAVPGEARDTAGRVILFPRLTVGQIIRYQIGYHAATNTSTESTVAAPMPPTGGQINTNILLQVEVADLRIDAGKSLARLRTRIVDPDAASTTNTTEAPNDAGKSDKREKTVELTLHSDGQVTDVEGLERLSTGEQSAWREWVGRFGGGAALPEKGVKPGEKWKAEEPITTALLTGLSWEEESEYVNDSPCGAMKLTPRGDPTAGEQ